QHIVWLHRTHGGVAVIKLNELAPALEEFLQRLGARTVGRRMGQENSHRPLLAWLCPPPTPSHGGPRQRPSLRLNDEHLSFENNGKSMKPSLAEISFLSTAPAELLRAMDERTEWVSIPSGWPLLSAGDPPDGVWFLVSGSLAAFRPTDKS